MGDSPQYRTRRLVLLLWLLVLVFYFYLSYDYIRASSNDRQFGSYLDYVVQLAGAEHRPAKETRALILVKAEELGLPIRGDEIQINGEGQTLKISLSYEVDIDFPGLQRVFYHKIFTHAVAYHQER